MREEPFVVDLQCFRALTTQQVRFKKQVEKSPVETIYQFARSQSYQAAVQFEFLKKYAQLHYVQKLQQLIKHMNFSQEEKARNFCEKNLKWLSEKIWFIDEDFTKVSQYLKSENIDLVEEIMNKYGFKQRYPDQFFIIMAQLQKIQFDMFKQSLKSIYFQFLLQEAEKDRQKRRNQIIPLFILNLTQFKEYCSTLKIYSHQQSKEMIFEAVRTVGIESVKIVQLVKMSTFPAFEENLISLLAKVDSLHLSNKILLDLISLYLFLSLDFKLKEEFISAFVRSYYESGSQYQQIVRCIGLEEEEEENYIAINQTLSSYITDIAFEEVKIIIVEEIKMYDEFMKTIFKVKQYLKQMKDFQKKQEIVQRIFGVELNQRSEEKGQLFIIVQNARKLFEEISKPKLSNTFEQYKRVISFFLFFDFDPKNFKELKNSLKKERDPSIEIKKISEYRLSQISIPARISENLDFDLHGCLSNRDSMSIKRESVSNNDDQVKNNKRLSQVKEISSEITQADKNSPLMKKKNIDKQPPVVQEITDEGQSNCFKLLILAIPNESCIKVVRNTRGSNLNKQLEFEKKTAENIEFYYQFQSLEQNQFQKISVSFIQQKKQSYIKSIFKQKLNETQRIFELFYSDDQGIKKIEDKSGLWLIDKRNDNSLLSQAVFKCFRSLTENISDIKKYKIPKSDIELTFLLASVIEEHRIKEEKFVNLIQTQKIKYHVSSEITVLFIYFIHTIAKDQTYNVLKECGVIPKLCFDINGLNYFTHDFHDNENLKNLYLSIFVKYIICKPSGRNFDPNEVLYKYINLSTSHISMKKVQTFGKLYPHILWELNDTIHEYMQIRPFYDAYDYILIKMRFMRKVLQSKSNDEKFDFLKKFIKQLQSFTIQTKKSQHHRIKILQHLTQEFQTLLVRTNCFFSKRMCLDNANVYQLYKESKILELTQKQIGQLFINYFFPYINVIDSRQMDRILIEKIKIFLLKPQTHHQFDLLQKYFKNQTISLEIFKALISFQLENYANQKYQLETLHFLFVEYIINNKDFISLKTRWISEMLSFLINIYQQLMQSSRETIQFKENHENCINLKHKIRLIIKRICLCLQERVFQSFDQKKEKVNEILQIEKQLRECQFRSQLHEQVLNSLQITEGLVSISSVAAVSIFRQ